MIPKEHKINYCYSNRRNYILECNYFISTDCPNTCEYADRILKGISHKTRTGLQRFLEKYGDNYLEMGVGSKI